MGTRSLTCFYSNSTPESFRGSIYCQFDGYPSGHLKKLREVLNGGDVKMINGVGYEQDNPQFFNGIDDLGAYVIKMLKERIGGVYLHGVNPLATPKEWEEWGYVFRGEYKSPVLTLDVYRGETRIWTGPFSEADPDTIEALTDTDDLIAV